MRSAEAFGLRLDTEIAYGARLWSRQVTGISYETLGNFCESKRIRDAASSASAPAVRFVEWAIRLDLESGVLAHGVWPDRWNGLGRAECP